MTQQNGTMSVPFSAQPRLIHVGERVSISLTVDPTRIGEVELSVFPNYLEQCDPDHARRCEVPLAWLDDGAAVALSPDFHDGRAELEYTPESTGNYMIRLRVGDRSWYRYVAVVDETNLVYRMECFGDKMPAGCSLELRNGGIPIDWTVNTEWIVGTSEDPQIAPDPDANFLNDLRTQQEIFGDLLIPGFYCALSYIDQHGETAFQAYAERVVARMQETGFDIGRAVNDWEVIAEALAVYESLGFDVVDGLIPEGVAHQGAPWFPYWMSDDDYLSPAAAPTTKLAMIMDFCAGFHFHGPPDFHMAASNCNWQVAASHADHAAREHALIAENSGSGPVFVATLLNLRYDRWEPQWPSQTWSDEETTQFVRDFLDDSAFEHARKYPIVFARCTDIADYLRRHPAPQPRRVLSSVTRDWPYDRIWAPEWCNAGIDTYRDVLPFNESLQDIRERRPAVWAKPTARELIYYEDDRHKCRFEYACPKPMLWFDYSNHRRLPVPDIVAGRPAVVSRHETEVPDPEISMETRLCPDSFELRYSIAADCEFPGYKLAVWDIPREFATCQPETNAGEFLLVRNTEGNYRGILIFDLKAPVTDVQLKLVK